MSRVDRPPLKLEAAAVRGHAGQSHGPTPAAYSLFVAGELDAETDERHRREGDDEH